MSTKNVASLILSSRSSMKTNALAGAAAVLSPDGRFVSFVSTAPNLLDAFVTNPQVVNLYVRDLSRSRTILASVSADGRAAGNGHSSAGQFSADGRFIVFSSAANNLVNNDANGVGDVFVRDLVDGKTRLISHRVNGTDAGNGLSHQPCLSADGRWVAFASAASDLVASDTNGTSDVFLHDGLTSVTTLISSRPGGEAGGNGSSTDPVITPDGRRVAYVSTASDLSPGATNTFGDIFVRDVANGTTDWASKGVSQFAAFIDQANKAVTCSNPAFDENGRAIVFKAAGVVAKAVLLLHYNLISGETWLLSTNAVGRGKWYPDFSGPLISRDGRYVVSEVRDGARTILTRWDLVAGTQLRIAAPDGDAGGSRASVSTPAMSADGRFIAFFSGAPGIVAQSSGGAVQLYLRDCETGVTRLVSARGGNAANEDINGPASISEDGAFMAFDSRADNLSASDLNHGSDVFVSTVSTGQNQIASARSGAAASTGNLGSNPAKAPFDDAGRLFLFSSSASDLAPNDRNGATDIFVRVLESGETKLVSVNGDGSGTGNGMSRDAVISSDGRFVAFVSGSSDLTSDDTNQMDDVFLRDLITGKTTLVSVAGDSVSANAPSFGPSISRDGHFVAFLSAATNLVKQLNLSSSVVNLFLRDVLAGTTTLVSIDPSGKNGATSDVRDIALSPEGRAILFVGSSNLAPGSATNSILNWLIRDLLAGRTSYIQRTDLFRTPVFRDAQFCANNVRAMFLSPARRPPFNAPGSDVTLYDSRDNRSVLAGTNAVSAAASDDGSWIAYETIAGPNEPRSQIRLFSEQLGGSTLISVKAGSGEPATGDSRSPRVSGDGRFVVFQSNAPDLTANSEAAGPGIFLYDRFLDRVFRLAGSSSSGAPEFFNPSISRDGRTVAFSAISADLASNDFNGLPDIFLLRLARADSDGDGLDDDWELTYFGTLNRDGKSDFDADGQTDEAEFRAGTNPANDASLLRVLTLTRLGTSGVRLFWASVPGKRYQIQFRANLESAAWTPMGPVVIATDSTALLAITSQVTEPQGFFRAVLIE